MQEFVFVYLGKGVESFTCPIQTVGSVIISAKTANKAQKVERSAIVNHAIANGHLIVCDAPQLPKVESFAPTVENPPKR